MSQSIAAYIYIALTAIVVIFQFALAMGAPWGEMAMGGKYPGRFPAKLRVAALVQIILLSGIALVVMTRAGFVFGEYYLASRTLIWFVVAFFAVGTILNMITPSKKEKALWAPVSLGLFACAAVVAMS